jgi:hypothetical protein
MMATLNLMKAQVQIDDLMAERKERTAEIEEQQTEE